MSTTTRTTGSLPHNAGFWRRLMKAITGCQHQYQVTLVYYYEKTEEGNWVDEKFVSRTNQIGVDYPVAFDFKNRRDLHKFIFPDFLKTIDKKYLRNGSPRIENIQYLGYFK